MEYKATLDLKAKIITGCCAVIFTAMTIYNLNQIDFTSGNAGKPLALLFTTVLVVSVLIICYLLQRVYNVIP